MASLRRSGSRSREERRGLAYRCRKTLAVVRDAALEHEIEQQHVVVAQREQRLEAGTVRADRGNAHGGALEEVVVGDLGGRDLEAAAQARLERPEEGPLLLEPAAGREVEIEDGEGDDAEDTNLDPDAGKSQQQVIDEMTGQLNLFTENEDL